MEDKFELFKILYFLVKIIFDYKCHLIKLALLMQLVKIIDYQLIAFLDICYNNIKITLLSNF